MSFPYEVDGALFGAHEGAHLRVRHILFDEVRARCAAKGLREGDEVTCRAITRDRVLLDVEGRGPVELELPLATFVAVEAARER